MSVPTPTISVIVVCKNPGVPLRTCLESVWSQLGAAPEIIVIDGGSTDGSCEWLEVQRHRVTTFLSGTDRGVYDAMNKGVAAAHGEWIFFLGADDRLATDTVLGTATVRLHTHGAEVAVGEVVYDDGRIYAFDHRASPLSRNQVHHQAAFYRRQLFLDHGSFDSSLRVMADYEFNLRLRGRGVCFESLPLRIAHCGSNGLSDSGRWLGYAEEIGVRHRYFASWRCFLWDALSIVRFVRKKILRSFLFRG